MALPGIAAPDARGSAREAASLFQYESLSELTSYFVRDRATVVSLSKLLAEAAAALKRGDRSAEQAAVNAWIEGTRKAGAALPDRIRTGVSKRWQEWAGWPIRPWSHAAIEISLFEKEGSLCAPLAP